MTKIGSGDEPVHPHTIKEFKQDLIKNTFKFQSAMEAYAAAEPEEKTHLRGVMDEQLGLIKASVAEIKRRGLHKEDVKLEVDYHKFIDNPHDGETRAALAQDIETLREAAAGGDPPVFGVRG